MLQQDRCTKADYWETAVDSFTTTFRYLQTSDQPVDTKTSWLRKARGKVTYFWSFSTSSASSSALLFTAGGRCLWRVISFGVWGCVSFRWSHFTGDGPDKQLYPFSCVDCVIENQILNWGKESAAHLSLESGDCAGGSVQACVSGTAQSSEPWAHKAPTPLPFFCCQSTG